MTQIVKRTVIFPVVIELLVLVFYSTPTRNRNDNLLNLSRTMPEVSVHKIRYLVPSKGGSLETPDWFHRNAFDGAIMTLYVTVIFVHGSKSCATSR